MRVLHVIPAIAPRYGGPSRAIIDMCRALRAHGVETLIATTDADGAGRLAVNLERPIHYEGVPAMFFRRQASEAFKYSHPLARWLERHVSGFDLVHIDAVFSHASLAAAHACRRHHVPYVVRPLGTLSSWSMQQKTWRKRLLWHLGVERMLAGAAFIHYTTLGEQRAAERVNRLSRGVVIPLGIDVVSNCCPPEPVRSRTRALTRNPYVLSLSRIHPKKNLDLLIEVFQAATKPAQFAAWRLVIAGDGKPAYVARLKALAREKGIADRVLFCGWLTGELKDSTLNGAALLALPSSDENFGLAVVEALACGVPVLISEQVNLADEVENARAGWVAPLSRDALVRALSEILQDDLGRAERGQAGRTLVQTRFSWERVSEQLVEMYNLVLSTKAARTIRERSPA